MGLLYVTLLAALASLNSCNLGFDLGVTAGAILGISLLTAVCMAVRIKRRNRKRRLSTKPEPAGEGFDSVPSAPRPAPSSEDSTKPSDAGRNVAATDARLRRTERGARLARARKDGEGVLALLRFVELTDAGDATTPSIPSDA